ncbi:Uncharacterized protein TCM_042196 [Theobroma cacao]|uniref:Uncharacterized protein n=1 Tax=Theobroma cacao TaxID=3641 RepID=A0A061H0D0_THECC|nr:Uncharacterized protein TCM_042196 [Theobroma cacao]
MSADTVKEAQFLPHPSLQLLTLPLSQWLMQNLQGRKSGFTAEKLGVGKQKETGEIICNEGGDSHLSE